MKKDFKRIPITIDKDKQTKWRSNLRLKQRLLRELYKYVNKFVKVEHEHELQGNFYNEFVERFLAKYQSEFPPISVVKMLDAMDVDTNLLEKACNDINAIDIKLDDDLHAEEPDFNIYTESEDQNKLYKALEKVCTDLKQLHDMGVRLTPQNIQMGTNQALIYDWSERRMKPNLRRILGTERG